jgi:hypothetical protein
MKMRHTTSPITRFRDPVSALLRGLAVGLALMAGAAAAGCGGSSSGSSESEPTVSDREVDEPEEPGTSGQPMAGGEPTGPSSGGREREQSGGRPVILGERFTPHPIPDPQQGGLPVGVVSAPESWRFDSRIVWNYGYHSNPVAISMSVENPANAEAVYAYPNAMFFDLRPMPAGIFQPGQNVGGVYYGRPAPPVNTLVGYLQRVRGNAGGLRLVGSKELPGLRRPSTSRPRRTSAASA